MIKSSNGDRFFLSSLMSLTHQPSLPEAYKIGKSSCSSVASKDKNKSNTSSNTSLARLSFLSILLIITIGFSLWERALPKTNLVCGIGPSEASVSNITPSAIQRTRSTSPPKSAWPGVSIILIFVCFQIIDVGFAKIVIPLSFSRSPLSRSLSSIFSFKWMNFSLLISSCSGLVLFLKPTKFKLSIFSNLNFFFLKWSFNWFLAIEIIQVLNLYFSSKRSIFSNAFENDWIVISSERKSSLVFFNKKLWT